MYDAEQMCRTFLDSVARTLQANFAGKDGQPLEVYYLPESGSGDLIFGKHRPCHFSQNALRRLLTGAHAAASYRKHPRRLRIQQAARGVFLHVYCGAILREAAGR